MPNNNTRKLFVNMAVKDLSKSTDFFKGLNFEFNPKFTDANAACLIVNPEACVMLLQESYFKTFTKHEICDTSTSVETLLSVACESRAEVETFTQKALSLGARPAMPPQEMGFMYNTSFYDLDGHHWEVFWMDPNAEIPKSE